MTKEVKILTIIPARNEEEFIGQTIGALGKQKPKPALVVLIDDGSTDKTEQIATSAAKKADLNFRILKRKDRGYTALGQAKLAQVYNDGFSSVNLSEFDFLLINGADSLIEVDYTEKILQHFEDHPNLMITSGRCPKEGISKGHVHGSAGRFYRMEFFIKVCKSRYEISYAWESIPLYMAKSYGFLAQHFDEPIVHHLRPRSTKAPDRLFLYRGAAMREVGYWTPFVIRRCILDSINRKQAKVAILMFIGFVRGTGNKHLKQLAKDFRKYQINYVKEKMTNKIKNIFK
ncbi:MAG: glycosyltransferase family A protein [Candidatus Heimdallarchaeota archaeon]